MLKSPDLRDVLCRLKWLPFATDIKPLVRRGLRVMDEVLDHPTKENTYRQNSHILIDMRDEFLARIDNPGREREFRAVWNFIILMYEDPAYCEFIDEEARRFIKTDWDFNAPPPDYDQLGSE